MSACPSRRAALTSGAGALLAAVLPLARAADASTAPHRTAPHWAGRAARSSKLFQQNWQVAGTTAEGLARRVQADA
ncbi:MAG: hypothetical protein KGQ30_01200 [Burkholderiales bacterium]|nr:hypothetical protein [Burkholderiales bacterium]